MNKIKEAQIRFVVRNQYGFISPGGATYVNSVLDTTHFREENAAKNAAWINGEHVVRVKISVEEDPENVPRVGVGAVILRLDETDDAVQILLGRRINKDGHGDQEWSFPGGKLDWMESVKNCAVRETLEEAGVDVIPIDEMGITNDYWPDPVNKHFLTVYILCQMVKSTQVPTVMEPTKCAEWKWFPLLACPRPMMLGSADILARYFNEGFKQINVSPSS